MSHACRDTIIGENKRGKRRTTKDEKREREKETDKQDIVLSFSIVFCAVGQFCLLKNDTKRKHIGLRAYIAYFSIFWKHTFAKIGEDWVFLALLGVIMALLSFIMDHAIQMCSWTRLWLYNDLTGGHIVLKYIAWVTTPLCLILFAAGFVHIVAPQAVGSGIPEMKTILRGVVLNEYLTFRTLVAKMVGLTCTLGSGLPLGKEGPFVHIASIVATLLSKLITSFKGIYENESRTGEMLAAASAVGVAATFYAPIGGVLFSIEVTSVFFAVRNYWRGFFTACCGATVWRLLGVWIKDEEAITALFKTSFRSDFPFDPPELVIFALLGVVCGFLGAGYVAFHRQIVQFNRRHKRMSAFLQRNRFLYPGIVTVIITTFTFPEFLGQYMASTLSTHDSVVQLFSNVTWGVDNPDVETVNMLNHWSTKRTTFYFHLAFYVVMTVWMSALASTIPVPSGLFIPVFKIGAALGRLVGELMAWMCPEGIPFGGYTNPIVPGGYAVVGAAAFSGAVTHTISTSVIAFELTGQMSHIIPVIIAVLIANGIAQALRPSIYDSIIQIKKLPFLPNLLSTSSAAHSVLVEDIMVSDVIFVCKTSTYRELKNVIKSHRHIQSYPLVESGKSMILLGSVQRVQLHHLIMRQLGKDRRLQEVQRRYSHQGHITRPSLPDTSSPSGESAKSIGFMTSPTSDAMTRRQSRFEVTPVSNQDHPQSAASTSVFRCNISPPPSPRMSPVKSILKHTPSFTYSPSSTLNQVDSRLRQAFENIFVKSLNLKDANANKNNVPSTTSNSAPTTPTIQRRVQLPKERVIDMSQEEQLAWEEEQLNMVADFSSCQIDPAPFQLVEHTSLYKVHSLFSMLGLNHAYVTSIGRLVGVVALKEIRIGIETVNAGNVIPRQRTANQLSPETDAQYEDTLTSIATTESETKLDDVASAAARESV